MMISIRLRLTVYLCMSLMLGICVALFKANQYQQFIYTQLIQVMKIQLSVDNLRSQLWVYQEYSDELSLVELNRRQAELAQNLSAPMDWDAKQKRLLNNLNRLNTNTRVVINMQLANTSPLNTEEDNAPFYNMLDENVQSQNPSPPLSLNATELASSTEASTQTLPPTQDPAARFLQARYNMIIQEMTEDVFSLHQMSIKRANYLQQNLLIVSGIGLLLLSLIATLFAHLTLKRFRAAITSFMMGVKKLAQGDMHSKVQVLQQDEFTLLAKEFNDMKECLKGMTIKKDELVREVDKQTQVLTEQQVKLKFLAEHDELTGIFNRRALLKYIDIAIARASRSKTQAALLFIDLNDFKIINDSLGHNVGDQVIITIAKRLHGSLRNTDMVGRLGGDEFVVWLDVIADKQFVIQKIEQLRTQIIAPMEIEGHSVAVGASIGVSLFSADGNNSELLIRAADVAMYQAKEHPEMHYYFFSDIE